MSSKHDEMSIVESRGDNHLFFIQVGKLLEYIKTLFCVGELPRADVCEMFRCFVHGVISVF